MLARTLVATALVLTLATPAIAGTKQITTHGLQTHPDGELGCRVVNASVKKVLAGDVSIVRTDSAVSISTPFILDPNNSFTLASTHDLASHCIIRIASGSTKDARVSVWVADGSGHLIAAAAVPSK